MLGNVCCVCVQKYRARKRLFASPLHHSQNLYPFITAYGTESRRPKRRFPVGDAGVQNSQFSTEIKGKTQEAHSRSAKATSHPLMLRRAENTFFPTYLRTFNAPGESIPWILEPVDLLSPHHN